MKLPLRLLPSRRIQIFAALFFLFGAGILVWAMLFELSGGSGQKLSPGIALASWLFMGAFLLGVLAGLATAIMRLLPGSPFFHLELTADAIVNRRLLNIERRRWKELGPFVVTTLPSDNEVTCIVAMPAGATARDGKTLYQRAVFRLRISPYCGDDRAAVLADWLNAVRLAMIDLKAPVPRIGVPPAFQKNILGAEASRKRQDG